MTTVYSTSTPAIDTRGYHFDYPSKRSAYIDACTACYALNQAAKDAPDNYRYSIYRLKNRWIEKLYRQDFCVQAFEDCNIMHFRFKIDGFIYAWHIPAHAVTWSVKEKRGVVFYEWRYAMPTWHRSLGEAIALLEWVLA